MSIAAGIVAAAMMAPPTVDPKQHNCLALNIYHEARGERVEGQIAVAHVTMNRVNHEKWPSTICEVVYQPKQFSWTHDKCSKQDSYVALDRQWEEPS